MKIHFFTKRDAMTGSSRQRAFRIADSLNSKGVPADVHAPSAGLISETHWPKKAGLIWKHIVGLREIQKGDIMYLQRPLGNKYLVVLLVLHKLLFRRKWYFDMDDGVFVYLPHKTKFFTKLSDVIIVGSHYLEDWAKKHNSNVHIVPTAIDHERYKSCTHDYSVKNNKLTIGWIGGANHHYHNLKLLVPVFEELVKRNIPLKFVLVGAQGNQKVHDLFNNIPNLEAEMIDNIDWTDPLANPRAIQGFDIGVMPLVDDPTTRGKCSFKAIEYMGCGIVPIISPVGENNYLVQDGVNGFLANDTQEWVDKIIHLHQNPSLYAEIGKKAQRTIEERYSFKAVSNQLIEIFKTA